MALIELIKKGFKCERCNHEWIPHNINQEPAVCPSCKSPYWNRPHKNNKRKKNDTKKRV